VEHATQKQREVEHATQKQREVEHATQKQKVEEGGGASVQPQAPQQQQPEQQQLVGSICHAESVRALKRRTYAMSTSWRARHKL
jgi:hypothetical protein